MEQFQILFDVIARSIISRRVPVTRVGPKHFLMAALPSRLINTSGAQRRDYAHSSPHSSSNTYEEGGKDREGKERAIEYGVCGYIGFQG
eukprot:scaffold28281_cov53-Attheya_sp.AAC.1